jgi:hypothetical protein
VHRRTAANHSSKAGQNPVSCVGRAFHTRGRHANEPVTYAVQPVSTGSLSSSNPSRVESPPLPISDIIQSIRGNALLGPTAKASAVVHHAVARPKFGSVYYGTLPCFAFGEPHFAMVQSRDEPFWGSAVALSPITSRRQDANSEKYCLEIPAGILPSTDRGGGRVLKTSWVLLPIILRVSLSELRKSMRLELRLPEHLAHEAESKLLKIT